MALDTKPWLKNYPAGVPQEIGPLSHASLTEFLEECFARFAKRNAVEAMADRPQRELLISTSPAEGDMVQIDVADTGAGLAPEVAEQLFQPFVTTKRHGMGVGLSISRTIIEAHGGRIWAEANPGGGTIFHLTLRSVTSEDMPDES